MYPTEQHNNERLAKIITDLIKTLSAATRSVMSHSEDDIHLAINNLLEIWLGFTQEILKDPAQISDAQIAYWQDYLALCEDLHQQFSVSNQRGSNWKSPILFAFVEKFYFLVSRHAKGVLNNIFDVTDGEQRVVLEFFHRKFVEAFSLAHLR